MERYLGGRHRTELAMVSRTCTGGKASWEYEDIHGNRKPNNLVADTRGQNSGQWGHEVGRSAFQHQLCCLLLLVLRWASLEVRV